MNKIFALKTSLTSVSHINRQLSTMVKASKFLYTTRFQGEPKLTDFTLQEEELPPLGDGDVLAEAIYHSVDPYMRAYMIAYPLGVTMIGSQIAKVIECNNKDFPKGSIIHGNFGWRTHTIFNPAKNKAKDLPPYILPSFGKHPISLGLGTLGMTGITAYYGFLNICKPKPGEVVAVTGAAGAVGSLVGQIAKLKGCKVIGFAGSDEKCKWLTEELGFDHAINYKTADITKSIRAAAPDGIDCYFDNVGGKLSSQIISRMKNFGRISVCGAISNYNNDKPELVPALQPIIVQRQLTIEGFVVWRYIDKWMEGINIMYEWVKEGKIKYHETQTDGFKNLPQALIDMLRGKNTGKAIVKSHL